MRAFPDMEHIFLVPICDGTYGRINEVLAVDAPFACVFDFNALTSK